MAGADVTSAAARAHCPSSEAVVIDIRGTSVAAAWLEREFVPALELEEALADDVGRDAALFEVLLDGRQVLALPLLDGPLRQIGHSRGPCACVTGGDHRKRIRYRAVDGR